MVVSTAETCWALSEYWIYNKISGIKLVSLYSTIKMMHGPINIRFKKITPVHTLPTHVLDALVLIAVVSFLWRYTKLCESSRHVQSVESLFSGASSSQLWHAWNLQQTLNVCHLTSTTKRSAQCKRISCDVVPPTSRRNFVSTVVALCAVWCTTKTLYFIYGHYLRWLGSKTPRKINFSE